jgi:ribonucleotide reductase beta subunit family protein with ferritin-like domain
MQSQQKIKQHSLPKPTTFKNRVQNKSKWKIREETPFLYNQKPEPLLDDSDKRYALFPIVHDDIWKMYKQAEASFWTFEEIDLTQDRSDYEKLSQNEKFFINKVLSFFAVSDGIVNENLLENFAHEVVYQEARCFYGFQIAIENIHAETYSQLIAAFVKNKKERLKLFGAIENDACIKAKAEWCFKYTNPDNASFAERLIAFAACEGIFFSGSFCAVFWLKKRGKMPGLCFSNELISRDEGLHCDFACLLYKKHIINKLPSTRVIQIIREAVDIECKFIESSLPINLIGMNSVSMKQYIRFVADRLIVALGHDKVYKDSNPFDWMELISLQGKTNFFEKRVGEYSKSGVGVDAEEECFTMDVDF